MKFNVEVAQFWTYTVDADSADEAAGIFDESPGECGAGECTGYNIEAVTRADDVYSQDDLRSPQSCRGGCGKQLPASHHGVCIDCLLKRPLAVSS